MSILVANKNMKKNHCFLFALAFIITGCEFHCSMGSNEVKGKSVSNNESGGLTGAIIKNDIELEANDVKVSKAYLMDEQHHYIEENMADVGQNVILTVELDTGWTKIDGKSFIGASERIIESNGNVLLDSEDLFKDYDAVGLDSKIASLINLTAVVSKKSSNDNLYTVHFKVWDKKGKGSVSGKYKLQIR
jgi:hypothetical protein